MLKDSHFYPLAALLIVAMIALALSFGGGDDLDDAERLATGWTMEGPALRNMTVSPGSNQRYIDEDGGFIRLSTFTAMGEGPGSLGVFATLSSDYERVFAGRELRVTITARAAAPDPLERFDAAYFTVEGPATPWRGFELGDSFEDHSFTYTPPIIAAPPNADLVAIFPGRTGEQREMDVSRIRIEVID